MKFEFDKNEQDLMRELLKTVDGKNSIETLECALALRKKLEGRNGVTQTQEIRPDNSSSR